MTALEPYDYASQTLESATAWLDNLMSREFTDHDDLMKQVDELDFFWEEMFHIEADIYPFTPVHTVLLHNVDLRCSRIEDVLAARWRSESVRRSALAWLRSHYDECLEEPTSDAPVVFAVSIHWPSSALRGFVQAMQVTSRRPTPVQTPLGPEVVIAAPLWAHRYLQALTADDAFAWEVRLNMGDERFAGSIFYPPSRPVPVPEHDVLETALALWDPSDPTSTYCDFADAVEAAHRLCA